MTFGIWGILALLVWQSCFILLIGWLLVNRRMRSCLDNHWGLRSARASALASHQCFGSWPRCGGRGCELAIAQAVWGSIFFQEWQLQDTRHPLNCRWEEAKDREKPHVLALRDGVRDWDSKACPPRSLRCSASASGEWSICSVGLVPCLVPSTASSWSLP